MRFAHLAAVSLDEVTVLVPSPHALPPAANAWPVRFIAAESYSTLATTRHVVLAGTASAVEEWLTRVPTPLYVVTDSPAPTIRGRLNLPMNELAATAKLDIDWEPIVADVCSRHVRGIARLIVDHAHQTPDAEAACDAHGSVTYAELCSMAACLGELLASRVPACAAAPEGRQDGRAGDILVGVQLAHVPLAALIRRTDAAHKCESRPEALEWQPILTS